jgi:pimeloyl-ACP methyl ester carboxylesterase
MNVIDTSSETLAILPGLLCDGTMFARQVAALRGAVVVGGFYGTETRLEGMADYALARLPDRFALLGHSMGARVALEIVRKAPHRVSRLALADTGVHPAQPGEREKRYALRDLGRERGIGALVDEWLPPMLGPAARADEALVASLRQMCVSAGLERFEGQIEALLHRPALGDLLGAITCPTLVVVGEADAWSPVAQHEAIARRIPGAKLRVVPGAGHMLPAEAPAEFNAAIGQWLAWPATDAPQTAAENQGEQ